jgi:hypothetical protein
VKLGWSKFTKCGRPARGEKNGEPRCLLHLRKGSRA